MAPAVKPGWGAWLYVLDGDLQVDVDDKAVVLEQGFSIAMSGCGEGGVLSVSGLKKCHFVLLSGEHVRQGDDRSVGR